MKPSILIISLPPTLSVLQLRLRILPILWLFLISACASPKKQALPTEAQSTAKNENVIREEAALKELERNKKEKENYIEAAAEIKCLSEYGMAATSLSAPTINPILKNQDELSFEKKVENIRRDKGFNLKQWLDAEKQHTNTGTIALIDSRASVRCPAPKKPELSLRTRYKKAAIEIACAGQKIENPAHMRRKSGLVMTKYGFTKESYLKAEKKLGLGMTAQIADAIMSRCN